MPESTLAPAPETCPRPAEWIVFRGRTRRLFLCGGCKVSYLGRGRIMPYATEEELVGAGHGLGPQVKVFTGPVRHCGEAVGE